MTGSLKNRIRDAYNTEKPNFSYICGGYRRIHVNPNDQRVRRMLLGRGTRYYQKNHFFVYVCNLLLSPDVFFDIGVNYGECLFSVPLHSKTRIRGFEANADLIPHLTESIKMNDDIEDLQVRSVAMAAEPDQVISFFVDKSWSGKSTALGSSTGDKEKTTVSTTSIDRELSLMNDVHTALIKIDVEGYEPEVLKGAKDTNERIDNLIYLIEFDSEFLEKSGIAPADFYQALANQFSVYELSKKGLSLIESYRNLEKTYAGKEKIHTDLVLSRFSSNDLKQTFQTEIVNRNFDTWSRELWQLR